MGGNNGLKEHIKRLICEIYTSSKQDVPPQLEEETILLETGLDSLDFAILVTRLEQELGYDPFTLSDEAVYPQTFGEFVAFYEKLRPA